MVAQTDLSEGFYLEPSAPAKPIPLSPSGATAPGLGAKPQTFSVTPQGIRKQFRGERAADPEIQELRRQLEEVRAQLTWQAAERFLTPDLPGSATPAPGVFAELIEKQTTVLAEAWKQNVPGLPSTIRVDPRVAETRR